jgi:hypothetical protein
MAAVLIQCIVWGAAVGWLIGCLAALWQCLRWLVRQASAWQPRMFGFLLPLIPIGLLFIPYRNQQFASLPMMFLSVFLALGAALFGIYIAIYGFYLFCFQGGGVVQKGYLHWLQLPLWLRWLFVAVAADLLLWH